MEAHPFGPVLIIGKAAAKTKATGWTLENYVTVKLERVSWIIPNYLAHGKATALVGEVGQGKSLATMDVAARITTGRGFPEGAAAVIPPGSVLMLNTEDAAGDTIKPRFLLAGGDESRLYQLKLPLGVTFAVDNDADVRRLGEQLTAHPDIVCIMIDPILQHANSEKEQDVRRGVANMLALLQERKVALLYCAHFNKVAGKNLGSPLDKLAGAKAWAGLPRFVIALMRGLKKDEALGKYRNHFILAKTNIGSNDLPTQDFIIEGSSNKVGGLKLGSLPLIRWLGPSEVTMRELLENRQPKKPKEEASPEEVATLLQAELLNQPRPAADIYKTLEDMGCKRRTIERAKALLILNKVLAKPENTGGSWYWKLAD